MIFGWPLTTSAELAQVLRPGGHLRPDSALRTLRDKGVGADPITVVPRSSHGAHGRVVWYSSLMLDVARLVRAGDDATAEAAHASATKLAAHRSAGVVADWLVNHGGPDPDPAALDAETGGALTRLATLTAASRNRLLPRLHVDIFAGRIDVISGRTALVVDSGGQSLPIPVQSASPVDQAGSLVAVDTEQLSGGATAIWVRPAFDSDADPNERVGGGVQLLTPAERDRLARPVTNIR